MYWNFANWIGSETCEHHLFINVIVAMSETLLLSNGRLIDVAGGRLFDETSLLIVGGKIAGLFTAEQAKKVAADRVIAGRATAAGQVPRISR